MTTLRARLFLIWLLSLAASVALGLLLLQLYRQSSTAQLGRAEVELARICDRMADRYLYYVAGWSGPVPESGDRELQRDLDVIAGLALPPRPELASGILREPHETGPDPQLLATAALASGGPLSDRTEQSGRTRVTLACPLRGPIPDLVGWSSATVETLAGYDDLRHGMAVLLALMLGLSASLAVLVRSWSRRIGRIIDDLAQPDGIALPRLAATGAADVDRIVDALNRAGERLATATRETERQTMRAVAAERMAALGRVAAGVAHEIRNPIAAMRLRAESGLAGDDARRRAALGAILGQIDRLDRLSAELLAMTQRAAPVIEDVDMAAFLASVARDHGAGETTITVMEAAGTARFDTAMLRRALDNLVLNALRMTGPGGRVTLAALQDAASLRITVSDDGPGVDPALRGTLFEPFVTGRPDGTGLGLAIAREMVHAHGGTLTLAEAPRGASFVIELPQP
jgi:signal transduction histidine kinase